MTKFLEIVARKVISMEEASAETAVIVPNKRSALFLKDILKRELKQPFWLPEFFSLDSFFQRATGFSAADPLQLSLELFSIHQNLTGTNHRSLEDFLPWSSMIISDFNDVDLNLADAEQLFHHLSANKAIQEWNLDGSPLTTMQVNYLNFYHSMWDYYQQLRSGLVSKKQGYPGLIYKHLNEHFNELNPEWPWKHFIVAGINALSPAETAIFKQINQTSDVAFLWDVDTYYYTATGKEPNNPDPGRFIRDFIQQLNLRPPEGINNLLLTDKKRIDVVGVQGEIAQTKYAAQWVKEQVTGIGYSDNQLKEIAIVLPDEKMLVPLLNALPPIFDEDLKEKKYNITMGYPLKNSHFELILHQWAKLLHPEGQTKNDLLSVHLVDFLQNPLVDTVLNSLKSGFTNNLIQYLITGNLSSVTIDELRAISSEMPDHAMEQLVKFLKNCNGLQFIDRYLNLLTNCQELSTDSKPASSLEQNQLLQAIQVTTTLRRVIWQKNESLSLKAAQKVLLQFIKRTQVHLVGQPLEGIQVMGLLETRNLDFENVLVLSANEGSLPAKDQLESFIPFDIRHRFGLPLPKDSQDVIAYHFYRLLQRTKKATFVYNSSTGGLGSNDISRFLLQIENELTPVNPNIEFNMSQLTLPVTTENHHHRIAVKKTQAIVDKLMALAEKGLSPSAINTFIQCQLRFYFRYILKIYPPETLEQSMESNTFGSIVHGVLEQIYLPLVNKQLEPDVLSEKLQKVNQLVELEYRKYYHGNSPIRGKNLLMTQVTKKMIRQTILSDCKSLTTEPRILAGIETKLTTQVETRFGQIRLEGTIDRIDKTIHSDESRIIDYKTGRVVQNDLKINELSDLTTNPDFSKSFQLMQYALLYSDNHPDQQHITAGNISLRNHLQGFISPIFADKQSTVSALSDFKTNLIALIEDIFDPENLFIQTEQKSICTYCDYKQICNKTGAN